LAVFGFGVPKLLQFMIIPLMCVAENANKETCVAILSDSYGLSQFLRDALCLSVFVRGWQAVLLGYNQKQIAMIQRCLSIRLHSQKQSGCLKGRAKATTITVAFLFGWFLNLSPIEAQAPKVKSNKPTLTVLNVDAQGLSVTPVQLGNMVRMEVDKLDTFEVTDRYDVTYLLEKNKLNITNCFGKICMVETGKAINSDKIMGGSLEVYSNTLTLTLKLVDVKTETVEKTYIREFLNLPEELQSIVRVAVREMFRLSNAPELVTQLTKPYSYESVLNNPKSERLNLSGPRMGFGVLTGQTARQFTTRRSKGGYEAYYPAMFQCGYQLEWQYLSEGNFAALFEVLPMLSGFDQNMIIPSITIMNGLRNVHNGWEIAFGPTFNLVQLADVYNVDGVRHLASDWTGPDAIPYPVSRVEDSRGDYDIRSMFVVAVGKSFKSGKMNIPVNAYLAPGRDGIRFGVSFGYNARKGK
jgi:hypothetical protein